MLNTEKKKSQTNPQSLLPIINMELSIAKRFFLERVYRTMPFFFQITPQLNDSLQIFFVLGDRLQDSIPNRIRRRFNVYAARCEQFLPIATKP